MADLVKLVHQIFNTEEAYFFVEFIDQLLIVQGKICVSVTKVVQYISKMCPVSVNEIPTFFISAYVVPSREHCGQHATWVSA